MEDHKPNQNFFADDIFLFSVFKDFIIAQNATSSPEQCLKSIHGTAGFQGKFLLDLSIVKQSQLIDEIQ